MRAYLEDNRMIYKLDLTPRPNPLQPWMYIFMSLSIKQFNYIYDKLDFPFTPPEDLQQIARDFSITQQIILHNPVPESPSVDLLEGGLSTNSYKELYNILFTNTFTHLERM